ncbi:MAG: Glycosyl transferase family 2 [Candidatus Levybacteria bacterium GW2011_GWB1_35_5]|nr:MAG: Glycosyl transferase family 2 [Candidatus Levybacteria bacterium GW2011_GWB1_35_5]
MIIWPKISIVIPTLNEEKNIKKCLESIFCQDYPSDKLEVLIVDDDSEDQTVKIAQYSCYIC